MTIPSVIHVSMHRVVDTAVRTEWFDLTHGRIKCVTYIFTDVEGNKLEVATFEEGARG